MANQFQNDPHCVALYRFEDASGVATMGLDSIGGNDCLVPADTQDTVDFKEGAACANFPGNVNCGSADANLDPGFPGRYADASPCKVFSTVGWFKMDTYPAAGQHRALWGKYFLRSSDRRSYLWTIKETSGSYYLTFLKGYSAGTAEESTQLTSVSIQTGQWYHVGCTYDDTTGAVRLRLWDPATSTVYDTTATHSQSLAVLNIYWDVGGYGYPNQWNGINPFDGRQDEIAVFDDILTADEIDQIRRGIYLRKWVAHFATDVDLACEGLNVITLAPWYGKPCWNIRERLAFSTDIITSANGTEQRIALRLGIPLQFYRIPFLLSSQGEAAEWSNMVHAWLKRMWPVPLWPESTLHDGSLAAGASSIAIDTRYADYRANGLALVWDSVANAEMVEVASIAADALTLTRPLVRSHTGPLWVMPLRQGLVIDPAARTRHVGGGSSIVEMAFSVDDIAEVTGWTAAMTYDDLDVLTEPAMLGSFEWVERIDPDIIILQNRTGRIGIVSTTDFNVATQPHGWAPTTRAGCWALRQFLHAKRGQQKPFLVPSFHEDIVLSRPVGAADTNLYVVNRGHSRMGLNDLRTYLAFRPPLADIIPRKVTGISLVSDSEELIAINTAPGRAFPPGTGLCWVDRCRLAQDEIDFEWYDRGKLFCETTLRRTAQ